MSITLRAARAGDAPAILEIYGPIVTETAISFETEVPSARDIEERIARAQRAHAWIVAEAGAGGLAGYAYATEFRARAAYARSCETTVYVAASHQGQGVGRALMHELLDILVARGFSTAVAGIALPNDPSVALHAKLGFEPVGTFRAVGVKFEREHDVAFMQKAFSASES